MYLTSLAPFGILLVLMVVFCVFGFLRGRGNSPRRDGPANPAEDENSRPNVGATSFVPYTRIPRPVLVGGLIAGAFDITYAIVFSGFRGVPATRILQSVASGLLGSKSFEGGWPTAALGLALHFLIALILAFIFYLASRRLPALARHPVVSGLGYGFAVYWTMNLVVLPLSAFPRKVSFTPVVVVTGLLVHMLLIGLPIAFAVRRAGARKA
jgi:hypothetical protein